MNSDLLENKQNISDESDEMTFSFEPVVKDEEVEEKSSERLEKLRSYYAELGKVREEMERDLTARLNGEDIVEGEIEAKLYEYSHSWRAIADEIEKYDRTNGRRKGFADGEYHVGDNLVGMDFSGQDLSKADFSAANLQDLPCVRLL